MLIHLPNVKCQITLKVDTHTHAHTHTHTHTHAHTHTHMYIHIHSQVCTHLVLVSVFEVSGVCSPPERSTGQIWSHCRSQPLKPTTQHNTTQHNTTTQHNNSEVSLGALIQ